MLARFTVALIVAVAALGSSSPALAAKPTIAERILAADRVLFLGDSITYGGQYVAHCETVLQLRSDYPAEGGPAIVGVGLPSEGVTGLTENGHPFPRPNVHTRLEKTLAQFKPDLVFACYGMNDGIYHPFGDDRFKAYQVGFNKLIAAVDAAGADLVLLTPPPFDPLTARGELKPATADEHSWTGIYEHYDRDVLKRYAAWIMEQHNRVADVVDLHTPYNDYLSRQREGDPKFALSGDGIHPNKQGHAVMAQALLGLSEIPTFDGDAAKLHELITKRQAILRDAWLSHIGHDRPGMKAGLPLEEANSKAAELDQKISQLRTAIAND